MNASRRHFLALLPSLLATPLVYGSPQKKIDEEAFLLNLKHWFSDPDALQRVAGQVVSDQSLSMVHVENLATELLRQYKQGGEALVKKYLVARIEHDFSSEKIKMLDGWVLAETEAALSVLVSRA